MGHRKTKQPNSSKLRIRSHYSRLNLEIATVFSARSAGQARTPNRSRFVPRPYCGGVQKQATYIESKRGQRRRAMAGHAKARLFHKQGVNIRPLHRTMLFNSAMLFLARGGLRTNRPRRYFQTYLRNYSRGYSNIADVISKSCTRFFLYYL